MVTKLVMEPSEFCLTPGLPDDANSSVEQSESVTLARLGRMDSQASLGSSDESDLFRLQTLQPLTGGVLSFFWPSTIRSLSGVDSELWSVMGDAE